MTTENAKVAKKMGGDRVVAPLRGRQKIRAIRRKLSVSCFVVYAFFAVGVFTLA